MLGSHFNCSLCATNKSGVLEKSNWESKFRAAFRWVDQPRNFGDPKATWDTSKLQASPELHPRFTLTKLAQGCRFRGKESVILICSRGATPMCFPGSCYCIIGITAHTRVAPLSLAFLLGGIRFHHKYRVRLLTVHDAWWTHQARLKSQISSTASILFWRQMCLYLSNSVIQPFTR